MLTQNGFHSILKFLLWIFNIIYGLFGFISLVCGISALGLLHTSAMTIVHQWVGIYGVFGNKELVAGAGLLTSVGIFILISSVIGCVVLLRYSRKAMILYVSLIAFIMILQFAAAISSLSVKDKVTRNIYDKLHSLQNSTTNDINEDIVSASLMFKDIQTKWHCCGVEDNKDWWQIEWFRDTYNEFRRNHETLHLGFPGCCNERKAGYCTDNNATTTPTCCTAPLTEGSIYPPCAKMISDHLVHSLSIVGGASLTFAFLEIFGLVVSCLFLRSSRIMEGMQRF